jgi:hypothetical protein
MADLAKVDVVPQLPGPPAGQRGPVPYDPLVLGFAGSGPYRVTVSFTAYGPPYAGPGEMAETGIRGARQREVFVTVQ